MHTANQPVTPLIRKYFGSSTAALLLAALTTVSAQPAKTDAQIRHHMDAPQIDQSTALEDRQAFERQLNARLETTRNSIVLDSQGRIAKLQYEGETLEAIYENNKLSGVRVGSRTLKVDLVFSELSGKADHLVIRDENGALVDVVKQRFVPSLSSLPIHTQIAVGAGSAESLRAELVAQQRAFAQSSIANLPKKVCQDNSSCDGMRDMDNARCDYQYEQDMVIVDLVRAGAGVAGPGAAATLIYAAMLQSRASDVKYRCKMKAVSDWVACVNSC